jgi:hypothetical protein
MSAAHALAALTAGVVVIVPSAGFAWRAATSASGVGVHEAVGAAEASRDAIRQAQALLGGAVARFVATVALMAGAIVWLRPNPLAFFGTLVALQAAYWIAPLTAGPPRSRVGRRTARE